MNPLSLLFRPSQRLAPATSRLTRKEVRPPSLRHAPSTTWQRVLFWLSAPAPHDASPPLNRLPQVQDEFRRAIADIDGDAGDRLQRRIAHARSLRELWHMRVDVYNHVAVHRSESEAALRLESLNRHFPTRAPRSGFAPLAS